MSPTISATGLVHTSPISSNVKNPPCTNRSPRRLFPQRRITWSTLNTPMMASLCGYLPDKILQTKEIDAQDYEQDCSDDDSSSSTGTVKMNEFYKLELSGTKPWLPLDDCQPVGQPWTPHPLHHVDKRPGNVSPQICPSTQDATANGLSDAYISPSYRTRKADRKVRINSKPKVCGFGSIKTTQSLPNLRDASQHYELPSRGLFGSQGAIYIADSWDAAVQLYVNATTSQKREVRIRHHARISTAIPQLHTETEYICLNLIITNGPHGKHTCRLEASQSSLYFDDEPSTTPSSEPAKAEIKIFRNICDMDIPLDLYFDSSSKVLPNFRPSSGRVLSESVFLEQSVGPLILTAKPRSMYSSWKATTHPLSKVAQFDRIDTPPLYPLGLRDDLRIEIKELPTVKFLSLGALPTTDVIWNFSIEIHQLPKQLLECRMSLYLEVTKASSRLVTIESHGWTPTFFLVDGILANEQSAEWREHDGQLTLFKPPDMRLGPLKLELNWQEPPNMPPLDGNEAQELFLPRVLDCQVLSGSLRCRNIGAVFLKDPGTNERLRWESDTFLPTMPKGYRLYLDRTPKAQDLGIQRPSLSPILEGREANSDTAMEQDYVTADTSSDQSPAESGPVSSPDLEANNDPPSGESPREERTATRQAIGFGGIWTVLSLIMGITILFLFVNQRTSYLLFPPALPHGENMPNASDTRLSNKAEDLKYPGWEDTRLSHQVEDLGPPVEEDLGLESLTDSMIAGTESYGDGREAEEGWRWYRDVFDYALGWPGPL